MKQHTDMSVDYFKAMQSLSPDKYKLWLELGKGKVEKGFDLYMQQIAEWKQKLFEYKEIIKTKYETSLTEVGGLILKELNLDPVSKYYISNRIWQRLDKPNALCQLHHYYILPKMIKVVEKYLKDNNVNIQDIFDNWESFERREKYKRRTRRRE